MLADHSTIPTRMRRLSEFLAEQAWSKKVLLALRHEARQDREAEPVASQTAHEFWQEALGHPDRYSPVCDNVLRLAQQFRMRQGRAPLIADVACGPGILTRMIAGRLLESTIVGLDISSDMLNIAEQETASQGLTERICYIHEDMRAFALPQMPQPDIIVSRDAIQRLDASPETVIDHLMKIIGSRGYVYNTSFADPSDLNGQAQLLFIRRFRERRRYPILQEAWLNAYLNAPTYDQYKKACEQIAGKYNANLTIWRSPPSNVNFIIMK